MQSDKKEETIGYSMWLDTLDGLPEVVLPDGYTIRTSREGDGFHWGRILRESFKEEKYDEGEYKRILLDDPAYRADRIFFGCTPKGVPCATASAYRKDRYGPDAGYLHYLAVRPAEGGKGLGKAMVLTVLHKFRDDGLACAALDTQHYRLPAINLYLQLGFRPLLTDADEKVWESWCSTFARLGRELPEGLK